MLKTQKVIDVQLFSCQPLLDALLSALSFKFPYKGLTLAASAEMKANHDADEISEEKRSGDAFARCEAASESCPQAKGQLRRS